MQAPSRSPAGECGSQCGQARLPVGHERGVGIGEANCVGLGPRADAFVRLDTSVVGCAREDSVYSELGVGVNNLELLLEEVGMVYAHLFHPLVVAPRRVESGGNCHLAFGVTRQVG